MSEQVKKEKQVATKKLTELTREEIKALPKFEMQYARKYDKTSKTYKSYSCELFINNRIQVIDRRITPNVFNKLSLIYDLDPSIDLIKINASCRFCKGTRINKKGEEVEFTMVQCICSLGKYPVYQSFFFNNEDLDILDMLIERNIISITFDKLSIEESNEILDLIDINKEDS